MIVKNEEESLERCLSSVKDIVDQIVIVDTGSEDKTIEIAERMGAEVYKIDWRENFSEARNFSLSKVTSDWILYLDADEYLDPRSKPELTNFVQKKGKIGVFCNVRSLDSKNSPNVMKYARLFASSHGIRFSGRVHEQIEDSLLQNGYKLIESGITIHHTGYDADEGIISGKAERNLPLLLIDYNENPTGYLAYQLGNTFRILDDPVSAKKYYHFAIENRKGLPADYKMVACSWLCETYAREGDFDKASYFMKLGLDAAPEAPLMNLTASACFAAKRDYQNAARYSARALMFNKQLKKRKSAGGLLDIIVPTERIIYSGLLNALQTGRGNDLRIYLNHLESRSAIVLQKLAKGITPVQKELEIIKSLLTEESVSFFSAALQKIPVSDSLIDELEKTESSVTDTAAFWNMIGMLYQKIGNKAQAEKAFHKSLDKPDRLPSTAIFLISGYVASGRMNEAAEILNLMSLYWFDNPMIMKQVDKIKEILKAK